MDYDFIRKHHVAMLSVAILIAATVIAMAQRSDIKVSYNTSDAASIYGPQTTITCPAGSINIFTTTQNIPGVVWNAGPGASICFHAGIYNPTAPIYARANQVITGEYGAEINGTNVTQSYDQGGISIFSGWNCGPGACDNVTIRNFKVHESQHACIGTTSNVSWTVEYNEVYHCGQSINLSFGKTGRVAHNDIHNNGREYYPTDPAHAAAFGGFQVNDIVYEYNHFHDNTGDAKFCYCAKDTNPSHIVFQNNLTERDEFGIWFDGDGQNNVVCDNTFDDIKEIAVMNEISGSITICRNTIRRAQSIAIFVSSSHDSEVYDNTIIDSWRFIDTYVNCDGLFRQTDQHTVSRDMKNNHFYRNTMIMTSAVKVYPIVSSIGFVGCSDAEKQPWLTNTKDVTWHDNTYQLYDPNGAWFFWGVGSMINWNGWKAIPQDANSTMSTSTTPLPPPPPPPSASPDATMVPPATQIVDGSHNIWTLIQTGQNYAVLRNGVSAANFYGTKIYWKNSTIYAFGNDSNWYQWTGSSWTNIGPTQPGGSDTTPPTVSISSPIAGSTLSGTITINANASDNVGVVGVTFKLDGNNLAAEDTSSPYSINWNTTAATNGSHVLTATARDAAGNQTTSSTVQVTVSNSTTPPPPPPTSTQTPYSGIISVPGTIQAENYDNGGETIAYHDTSSGNEGGAYRSDNVDIKTTSDSGSGYAVGWFDTGEWLEYSVNVASSGTYDISARVASGESTGRFHIEFNGVDKTGSMTVPNTGAYETFQNVTKTGVSLSAGSYIVRFVSDSNWFDLNYLSITNGGTTPPPPPTSAHINLNPTSLSFTAISMGATPAPKTVSLSNSGSASLTFSASANQNWCHVSPSSGSVNAGSSTTLSVSMDSPSNVGTFTCLITVSGNADNSPQVINATYTVTPNTSSDQTPPTVNITLPANGGTVTRKATVTINASASDNVGVTKVEFYVNNILTCTDTTASYTCSWSVPASANKTYFLTAKAYDAAGNIATTQVVSVKAP